MFEAAHRERIGAPAAEIWALWSDPARWGEWNPQFERGEAEGELAPGTEIRAKYRRGGTVVFAVSGLEPERLLALEARLPGARLRHEHRLEAHGSRAEVEHRIVVSGPLSGFWALMLSRKRMRETVAGCAERERDLTA